MKSFAVLLATCLAAACLAALCLAAGGFVQSGGKDASRTVSVLPWPPGLPVYDHVVIVVEENKDYGEIIGNADAPYINGVLKAEGANFTRMFGEEHASQGNYFWLFSGSNQNVGFKDEIPSVQNHKNYPFKTSNLGEQLMHKGLTFKGYSESLPAIGSTVSFWPMGPGGFLYARKHVPWVSFANVPNGTTAATSSNLRFEDFPKDAAQYAKLPTVAFVIPNLHNDMHTGYPRQRIQKGDRWLKDNLDGYYQWAKSHNSLLILTFDENNDSKNFLGLTDPFVKVTDELTKDIQNRVVTIFAGAHVRQGDYAEGKGITHVNILRTLEAMYGLPKSGAQQPHAARGGISDNFLIVDVFTETKVK